MDEGKGRVGGFLGHGLVVLGLVTGDCRVNISFIDTTVLVSNTKSLLVKWGMGFTVDQPKNPLQPSLPPWLVQLFWPHHLHPLQL